MQWPLHPAISQVTLLVGVVSTVVICRRWDSRGGNRHERIVGKVVRSSGERTTRIIVLLGTMPLVCRGTRQGGSTTTVGEGGRASRVGGLLNRLAALVQGADTGERPERDASTISFVEGREATDTRHSREHRDGIGRNAIQGEGMEMTEINRTTGNDIGSRKQRRGTNEEKGDRSDESSQPDRCEVGNMVIKRDLVVVYSWNCDGGVGIRKREVGAAQRRGGENNGLGTGVDAAATPTQRLDRVITAFEQETRLGAVMLQQTRMTERTFLDMEESMRGFLRQNGLGIVVGHAAEGDTAAGVAIIYRPSLLQLVEESSRTGTIDESIDTHLEGRLLLADFVMPDMTEITLCCDYAYSTNHNVVDCRKFYSAKGEQLAWLASRRKPYLTAGDYNANIMEVLNERKIGRSTPTRNEKELNTLINTHNLKRIGVIEPTQVRRGKGGVTIQSYIDSVFASPSMMGMVEGMRASDELMGDG